MAGAFLKINEIKHIIALKNCEEFEQFETDKFYVGGNVWSLKLKKEVSERGPNVKKYCLSGALILKEEVMPENWSIVANFSLKIVSIKPDVEPLQSKSFKFVFDRDMIHCSCICFVWENIVDPERSYVYNNMCKIEVQIKSSPMQIDNDNELMEFVPIDKCCDASKTGSFRIKVNRVFDFVNVCSPLFKLNNIHWRLVLRKGGKGAADDDFLQIQLFCSAMGRPATAKNITARLTCEVVPSEPNVDRILKNMGRQEFKHKKVEHTLNIISWNELFDSRKKLVKDDSFILEVNLEVLKVGERVAIGAAGDHLDGDKFICPICLECLAGKSISIPVECGHIHCTECILLAIQKNPICPKCKVPLGTGVNRLKRVYL